MNNLEQPYSATEDYTADLVRTNEEREAVFAIRMVVFVEEQRVPPEEELDALDITATHVLARRADRTPNAARERSAAENTQKIVDPNGEIVGTARLVDKGTGKAKIGRVAVLQAHRGKGVGALLMRFVEQVAREQGFTYLALDAQCYAIPFYEKLGYVAQGDVFLDCAIEHRYMSKAL